MELVNSSLAPEMLLYAFTRKRLLACRATESHFERSHDVSRYAATSAFIIAGGPLAPNQVLHLPTNNMRIAEVHTYFLRVPLNILTTGTSLLTHLHSYMTTGIPSSLMPRLLLDLNNAVVMR